MADAATLDATNPQPAATVDWGHMRAMFVKGCSYKDIARIYGLSYSTVKSRAHRENWSHTVAEADKTVVQAATTEMQGSAVRFIGRLDSLIHKSLDSIEHKAVEKLGLRDLQIALDCMEKANRVARQNYGLDAQGNAQPKVQVNVQVMEQHAARADARWANAIDVEPIAPALTAEKPDSSAMTEKADAPDASV